jgi:hypothetical protein
MTRTKTKIGDNMCNGLRVRPFPDVWIQCKLLVTEADRLKPLKSYRSILTTVFCICAAIFLLLSASSAQQLQEQLLYSFQGGTDGSTPVGAIVFGKQGNLYGATSFAASPSCAGVGGCGMVYQLSPPIINGDPWTETILHVFKGNAFGDGGGPEGGLVMDAEGNLYGTTAYNGTGLCRLGGVVGCGVVYEMSPPAQPGGSWTETVIYSFQGGNDGYYPRGDLVFDEAGNLYGATAYGGGKGSNCGDSLYPNCGTVFELSPPQTKGGSWTEKVLYSFSGLVPWAIAADGSEPNGGLAFDNEGNIFGTAARGGSMIAACGGEGELCGCGAVFELIAPKQNGGAWTEDILYRFQGGLVDGAGPNGNLIIIGDKIYGTTYSGGGSQAGIFYSVQHVNDRWVKTTLYTFLNDPSPNRPEGGLMAIKDGYLVGAAVDGGANLAGALVQLTPPKPGGKWGLVDLYDFERPPAAAVPLGKLVPGRRDDFYGITQVGGTGQACNGGCGTVYEVSP